MDKVRYTRLIESPRRYFFTRNQQIWGDISNSIINLQVNFMLHHSQGNNRFGAVFERVKQSGTNPVTLFGNIPNFHAMSYAISTRLFHFGDVSLRFGSIFHIQTYRIKISIPLDKNVHVMFFMRLTRP